VSTFVLKTVISAESRFILCEAIIPCVLGSPGRSTLVKECLVKKISKRFVSKNIFSKFAPKLCFSMKKLYTIVWLLMTSLVLSAAEISQEQALENARSFMLQKSVGRQAKARAPKLMNMQAVPTGMPELYAFNIEGGGYVIASADDRTLPVLGYSLTGRFDASQMPDNMCAWLQGYAEQIRMLGNVSAASVAAADPGLTAIKPLIQTRWGQEEPYNLKSPVVDGQQTVTGCVATAMAQVMYYHQWPSKNLPTFISW
jgi:hypothetical protein